MEERATASRYPAPPSFYQHFTTENLDALRAWQSKSKQQQSQQSQQSQLQSSLDASSTQPVGGTQSTEADPGQKDVMQSDSSKPQSPSTQQQQQLPEELTFLVPPRPPTAGNYTSFGDVWHIPERNITLEEAQIPQLYADPGDESHSIDRAQELRRLSKSVLMNYLELVGVLGVNPGLYGEKITDLRNHFINLHQLINDYRPHQARETLIAMMEEQLETSKKETEANRAASRKMRELLKSLGSYDAGGLLDATALPGDKKNEGGEGSSGERGWKQAEGGTALHDAKEDRGDPAIRKKDENMWNMLQNMGAGA